jgi:ubiquitin-protein ligase
MIMSEQRFRNELKQLLRLKTLLDGDTVLPLRFEITPESLDLRRFRLTLSGITSLAGSPHRTADKFTLLVEVPTGYPQTKIPNIRFIEPVPFHPHVYLNGIICWGTGNTAQIDLFLVDWFRGIVEYLQYDQDHRSLLRIDPGSPANRIALEWWLANSHRISSFVKPIDLRRLRYWIDHSRG